MMVCRLRDMGSAPLSVGYARISSRNQIKNYRAHLFLPSQYFCVLSVLVITSEYFWTLVSTICATPRALAPTTKLKTGPILRDEGPDYSALYTYKS